MFYTDDESTPSYIEYKISCKNVIDCGFIMINVDGDDVAVPISSTMWGTPSEVLSDGKTNKKFYYYSPFSQYSEDITTKEVISINPRDNIEVTGVMKNEIRKASLKKELQNLKTSSKDYKKTDDFKNKKLEIKDEILQISEEEFSMNFIDMSYAAPYTSPWTANIFIPWTSVSTWCIWKTPCYKQFQTYYNTSNCPVWCAPNALGIIYGYYDNNGYSNLVSWTAPYTNTSTINTMIKTLWLQMGTYCENSELWNTLDSNIKLAIQYAKDKWYSNATSTYNPYITTWWVFNKTKDEIDAWRPVIITIANVNWGEWHAVVWFWYKSLSTNIVRVNMWWWWTDNYGWNYYTSNIDQNLNSIYYETWNTHKGYAVTTVKIN